MEYFMRQCRLSDGICETIAWIPEKFSIKNKIIRIESDKINGNWKVIDVGERRKTFTEVNERSQDYKRTRLASDI